jgi:outer membrane protein assembly factor BamB
VRTAITIGRGSAQGTWIAYFGDQGATVYAVDALTGALVWKRKVDTFLGANDDRGADAGGRHALRGDGRPARKAIGANRSTSAASFAVACPPWMR